MTYRIGTETPNHGRLIAPELLVCHTTEGGSKSYLDSLFSGREDRGDGVNVSVHWCVYTDGEIVEYAPWRPGRAVACWHAGQSLWHDMPSCNYWSLGFEIQHVSGQTYPEAQIEAVISLIRMVRAEYPDIEIVTHEQIAYPRGRKSDPTKPWKTDVWPRILTALGSAEEDDMTDEDRKLLRLARVSDVARSHDMEIIKAMIAGETPERIVALEVQKGEAVRAERQALGL
jgi:hypothetical protein